MPVGNKGIRPVQLDCEPPLTADSGRISPHAYECPGIWNDEAVVVEASDLRNVAGGGRNRDSRADSLPELGRQGIQGWLGSKVGHVYQVVAL